MLVLYTHESLTLIKMPLKKSSGVSIESDEMKVNPSHIGIFVNESVKSVSGEKC
jgi:hypothetical protein